MKKEFSIGNEILFELHKQKFTKIATLIIEKLKERESELLKQLSDDILLINEEEFKQVKDKLIFIKKNYLRLEMSSFLLFEVNFDELSQVLNLRYTNEKALKEEIIGLLRDGREYFISVDGISL